MMVVTISILQHTPRASAVFSCPSGWEWLIERGIEKPRGTTSFPPQPPTTPTPNPHFNFNNLQAKWHAQICVCPNMMFLYLPAPGHKLGTLSYFQVTSCTSYLVSDLQPISSQTSLDCHFGRKSNLSKNSFQWRNNPEVIDPCHTRRRWATVLVPLHTQNTSRHHSGWCSSWPERKIAWKSRRVGIMFPPCISALIRLFAIKRGMFSLQISKQKNIIHTSVATGDSLSVPIRPTLL